MEIESENKKQKTKNKKPDIRYLYDMKEVLFDQEWLKTAPNFEVYYMYRKIKAKGTLRYDETIIPAKMLGEEFPKTKGHNHPDGRQELYIVLKGLALFLFQKSKNSKVGDVFLVPVKKGEVIIIPPYYHHITINPSLKKTLKLANWRDKNCQHDYSLFEKMQGACYYYTKSGWIKNKNYKLVPKLKFKKPLKSIPKDFGFLE